MRQQKKMLPRGVDATLQNAQSLGVAGILALLAIFFVFTPGRISALESDRTIAQFAHTAWGPKDGAPSVVEALAQSADGYLWLGSPDGLYRFDGVVFERYQPQSGDPLPARRVSSLLALPNGDLWIGFRAGGMSLLRNGRATNYTTRDGAPGEAVWGFAQDRAGTIWAATDSGLARLKGNRWSEVGKDCNFPGKSAHTIFFDHQGTLWVSTEDTLILLPRGAKRFQQTGIRVGQVYQIAQAAGGKLWMAETTRSVRPIPLTDKRQPSDETEIQVGSIGILFDNDGALWITTVGDGLRRAPVPELLTGKIKEFSTVLESFTAKDGLSDDVVRAILQDREGNIWVGTSNGLDRFRKTNLIPVALPFKTLYAVLAAGDTGDVWVASQVSMVRVHGGRADRARPLPSVAISAYRDPAGAIWWSSFDAIYRYKAGNYTTVALPPPSRKPYQDAGTVTTQDGSGALWLAALREGLFYRKRGVWQRLETASEFARLSPKTAFTDWMGRAWFGYEGGTIIVLKDEKIQRIFSADDSPVGSVTAINGRGRHTWVGGERGLAFFDGKRFRQIIPADAEAFGSVLGVEETPDGGLWLAESRGVIQVPASEVQQALENPSHRVKYRIFDSFDGLSGTFAGTAYNRKLIQGTDGRLWFVASGGVVWVDPVNISTNPLAPPVLIESVRANGGQLGSLANLFLPPRTTNLQINYTALSLSVPERVRFRYRLEGVDKDWQDAGSRRAAFYTRLGPGEYHFQVIACNNDGVWNEEGAHLDFNITPAWYQTIWFRLLCILVGITFCYALYLLRLSRYEAAMRVRFNERLDERTRIARELHDTLLQTIQGSKIVADHARISMSDPGKTQKLLDQLSDWLARATQEGRTALESLHAAEAGDLTAALRTIIEGYRATCDIELSLSVRGPSRDTAPLVRDEVYWIAHEAIRNACKHSGARHIITNLIYSKDLELSICDDGRGIPEDILREGRIGHFGLRGMRERASQIGVALTISSSAQKGTEVRLLVPGVKIFVSKRSRPILPPR